MDPIEMIRLGREMRKAQKEFFRTHTKTALNKSMALEQKFDKAVEEFLNPSNQLCFEDFNTQPPPWIDIPLPPLK